MGGRIQKNGASALRLADDSNCPPPRDMSEHLKFNASPEHSVILTNDDIVAAFKALDIRSAPYKEILLMRGASAKQQEER